MYATVVPVLLSAVTLCVAGPYYLPQQRQLFYPVMPQYQQYQQYQYTAPLAAPINPYRQFYYPQASANLVSPVAGQTLRYPGHVVAAPAKQVLYYPQPQALTYPHNYVLAGDEAAEGAGGFGWPSWISNLSNYFVGEQPAAAQEGNSPAAGSEAASPAGEKVEQPESNEQPAKEDENKEDKENEENKENEEAKPENELKVKGVPQKFVTLQQPQFFGNFGLQRINPAMVLPSANHGAVSSYLLLKNYPGVRFAPDVLPHLPPQVPQVQQVPQTEADAELVPKGEAGKAALEYQMLLQQEVTPERQLKQFSDDDSDASVTVDAAITKDKPTSETESEADKPNDEEETGTEQNLSQ